MSSTLLYLPRDQVREICDSIDSIEVMREVFQLHASGKTILPDEAYLGWVADDGVEGVRSLNMPAYVGGAIKAAGTKIINSNPHNVSRNSARASGLTLLFDTNTGYITCLMEGAYVSALRTASVTLLALDLVCRHPIRSVAIIGAGAIGTAHAELAAKRIGSLERLTLFDRRPAVAEALAARLAVTTGRRIAIEIAESAEQAVRAADVVVAATTVTSPYIPFEWLQPGAVVVNVSLDDLCPDVFLRADRVIVDDWGLVRTGTRRMLGKMYKQGLVAGPGESPVAPGVRRIDAEIGDLVVGRHPGRTTADEIIVVNPFGLGIEDVALAQRIFERAQRAQLGMSLPV